MDAYERFVTADRPGLYESQYLKANSPDGERAIWIKHNVLRRADGDGFAELWAIRFLRGSKPIVVKREVPLSEVRLDGTAVALDAGPISLRPDRARGAIADFRWDLKMSNGLAPLFHYPHAWLYTGPFPKKKLLTPQPNLVFDGEVSVGDERWSLEGWRGMRGHNWGTEHAYTYAYGSCSQWDDGDPGRAVDGFTARIKLGTRLSPWLSAVVGHGPEVRKNHFRHWLGAGEVKPDRWRVSWWRTRQVVQLEFWADPADYAGLRYLHPDGRVSYCYNSKLSLVSYLVGSTAYTSRCGELEVLFPEPLPGVALHPAEGWTAADGDYRSS